MAVTVSLPVTGVAATDTTGLTVAFFGLTRWAKFAMTMTLVVVMVAVILVVLIIAIGGNSGTRCATNGTADNCTIPSTNFIAHGGSNGANTEYGHTILH